MTVLCGSVSKFRIFHNDVEAVKLSFAATLLVYFVLYVLTKRYAVV